MANFKRQLDDKYVDETFDEYHDRLYGKGTQERKTKPTFGDDTGKGFGGAGKKSDRNKPVSQRELSLDQRAEAAEAPVRRAEERIRREIAEEEAARKAGKPIKKIYQKGGTVEDKRSERTKRIEETKIEDDFMGIKKMLKAGALKASQLGDKVGFTQEEEYKDKKPVKKKTGGMTMNPFQGDDEDPFSGARDEEGAIKREEPKKKNRIVTKEEMKKAGFDNLRDFLNAERGLKRREPKSEPKPTSTKEMADDRRVKKLGVFGAKGKNPAPANPSMFKKGGMISSASKRADGVCKKGKTKGRMV